MIDRNNLRLAKANSVYPVKIMLGNECQFSTSKYGETVVCQDGWLNYYSDGQQNKVECENCHGSGLANRTSPHGTILVNPKTFNGGDEVKAADVVRFVEPTVTTLEFLKGEISDNTMEARRTLFLPTNNITTEGQKMTATENVRDEKAMEAFLQGVSNQDFDIYAFLLDGISWFRYGEPSMSTLTEPQTFDFTTEIDFIRQIGIMHEQGIDPAVIQMKTIQYMKTIYDTAEQRTDRVLLWVHADRLIGTTSDTISLKVARKSVATWEEYLHFSPFSLMDELQDSNPNFFDQELSDQVKQVKDLAKTKTAEIQTTSRQDLVDEIVSGRPNQDT